MDSFSLKCLVAIVEAGSFTRAAARLFRTQSAVSQQIAKLERTIGKPLFRRGSQLELTEAGEAMLRYARKILALEEEALAHFRGLDVHGEIRFGLPEDFASVMLSDVLVHFAQTHPKVALHVETDLTLNLLERFKAGEFDLVLVKVSRPDDFPHGVEIWSEGLHWVGHPDQLSTWYPTQPVPLVASPTPCVYRQNATEALESAGMPWRLVFSSSSYASAIAACKARIGITVLPESMIPSELVALDAAGLPPLNDTHVSLLKREEDLSAVRSLEEYVVSALRRVSG